jgi:hypothetical protein
MRPLFTELVHLRDLLPHLPALGFAHPLKPRSPLGRQPVERHRHVAIDRDITLDQTRLLDVRVRRPHRDIVTSQYVLFTHLGDPARVLPNIDHRIV